MRSLVLFALASLSLSVFPRSANAGQLDIAVLRFADERDQAQIEEALGKVDLLKITDSDRTETSVPGLRGGDVVFVQSIPAAVGSKFANSTRLGNMRADVSGSLGGSGLSVRINILEGVKVGLRKHREWTYDGNGPVGGGSARLISIRRSAGTSVTVVKNRSQTINYATTTIIVAQFTP